MRDILFRGKSIFDGEWLQGDLFHRNDEFLINNYQKGFNIAVKPETVGQFTGVTDKNGKKIFEGDIVNEKHEGNCVVRYSRHDLWCCGCCFDSHESVGFYLDTEGNGAYSDDEAWHDIEVIGNIHDNPELLEVKDNA